MPELVSIISAWSIPLIIFIILFYGFFKKVNIYETFTEGAREGISTTLSIFPYLLAMIIAIKLIQVSGLIDLLVNLFKPISKILNIPQEVFPLMFLRPLSGSGSLSYTAFLLQEYGPDSFIGKLASTIQGSTETTFYVLAVYFGAVGIKKYRYSLLVGLLTDIVGFMAAIFICRLLFL
ncbi:MAG TPA: spore maturation protein [Halanaerobiaceae bacterium]|nr:spore maturation protein [Bacillota bacterium]HHU92415.1 spore maturation protein [Halanaerobiaceae bacterium]HOA41021.1 spore maturation protein [Halanaerobiales bacterium]HPZ63289.1 spore maturation protein [Halanaerobiales bacterium]HQD04540.1 spore maturation protein [Halanaerobiales bacterium]